MMRTSVKSVLKAIERGDKEKANEAFKAAVPLVDRVVGKGLVHKNTAARQKARLNARIRAM